MSRATRGLGAIAAVLALGLPGLAASPAEISGLEAWYKVDSLHARLRDGAEVHTWEDATPRRHDLVFDGKSQPATFHAVVLNDRPVVEIRRGNRYKVAEPFQLDDHTIVLVLASGSNERALFRSNVDDNKGLLLFHNGQSHQYRNGARGHVVSYTRGPRLPTDYSITVLGRQAGVLRAFVDGVDRSSRSRFDETIRVGGFFDLGMTKFVRRDGEGLNLAEMLFYSRFLTHDERQSVERHLSEKYAIPVQQGAEVPGEITESQVRVRLTSSSSVDLNQALVPIEWNAQDQVAEPFRIDLENDNTAVICDRDGTRARVALTLPVVSTTPEAALRVLLLISGESYHPVEAATGDLESSGGSWTTTVEMDTTVRLDAGDYLEVIVSRKGGEGTVLLEPGAAELVIAAAD